MERRALLAGGAAVLAGCQPLRGDPAPPPENANYPRMLARFAWLPEDSSYRVRMVAGNRFTPDNTGSVSIVVDTDDYRETTWVGSTEQDPAPAQSFPLEVGDEIIVPAARRGTVRVVWQAPDGDRSVSLDALDEASQPTATPTATGTTTRTTTDGTGSDR